MAKKLAPVPYDTLLGLSVRIYKNLHNGKYSVQHKGIVIAHLDELTLTNVTFKVSEAGRQRVLRTKQKDVHAFVCGTVAPRETGYGLLRKVSYNPYLAGTFNLGMAATKVPVREAEVAELKNNGVWI